MSDDDTYPSEGLLEAISQWSGDLFHGGLHRWFDLAHDLWWAPEWGWKRDGDNYEISTGGWSGNEAVIDAMMENAIAWNLTWVQSRRGGHFLFEVPNAVISPTASSVVSP